VGDQNIDNLQNIDSQQVIVHDQQLDSSTYNSTTPPEVHHQPTVATELQSGNDTSNTFSTQRRSTRNRKPRDLFADSAHSSI
jgi:hypothetical protein